MSSQTWLVSLGSGLSYCTPCKRLAIYSSHIWPFPPGPGPYSPSRWGVGLVSSDQFHLDQFHRNPSERSEVQSDMTRFTWPRSIGLTVKYTLLSQAWLVPLQVPNAASLLQQYFVWRPANMNSMLQNKQRPLAGRNKLFVQTGKFHVVGQNFGEMSTVDFVLIAQCH